MLRQTRLSVDCGAGRVLVTTGLSFNKELEADSPRSECCAKGQKRSSTMY